MARFPNSGIPQVPAGTTTNWAGQEVRAFRPNANLPGFNPYNARLSDFPGEQMSPDNLRKYAAAQMGGQMTPDAILERIKGGMGTFFSDPNISGAIQGARGAMGQFGQGYGDQLRAMAGGQGAVMQGMRRQAMGQDSVVNRAAQAQRQAMARDMAMNTAAAGGMGNPLAMRNMAMAQGQMGQGMAAQVAAARAQERQQAQQNYLNARMGAANAAMGMDAQNFANNMDLTKMFGDFAGAGAGQGAQAAEMGGNYFSQTMGEKARPF